MNLKKINIAKAVPSKFGDYLYFSNYSKIVSEPIRHDILPRLEYKEHGVIDVGIDIWAQDNDCQWWLGHDYFLIPSTKSDVIEYFISNLLKAEQYQEYYKTNHIQDIRLDGLIDHFKDALDNRHINYTGWEDDRKDKFQCAL